MNEITKLTEVIRYHEGENLEYGTIETLKMIDDESNRLRSIIKDKVNQNKKLIEAVRGLIDKSVLPLQCQTGNEARLIREFIEQMNKVLSIISEIEGE
jgi:methionine aminopeptidase